MSNHLIRRNHFGTEQTPLGNFKIAVNVSGGWDGSPEAFWTDMIHNIRGPGIIGDGYRHGLVFPTLDPVTRWPTEDFALALPSRTPVGVTTTMKCKLLGRVTSMTLTSAGGYSITDITVVGDDTTFTLNAPIGAGMDAPIINFIGTRPTTASPVVPGGSGCRGIIAMYPGFEVTETSIIQPYMAAALAPYSTLRFMDMARANNNTYTVTPADRSKDGVRSRSYNSSGGSAESIEDAIRVCNALGKNLWWCIPINANDALITEFATVIRDNLDPSLYCILELGNENWNSTFKQMNFCVYEAMSLVNGFAWQYAERQLIWKHERVGNVLTAIFTHPHGFYVGQTISTYGVADPSGGGAVSGNKIITAVPDAVTASWAEVGADYPMHDAEPGVVRSVNILTSINILGTTMTITYGRPHGWTAGVTQTKATGITRLGSTLKTVQTTPDAYTATFVCTAGVDGPVGLNGSMSQVGGFTNPLNSYDQISDQHLLCRRYYAKRTVEMSILTRAVFAPADWGVRIKIGLMNQPGTDSLDQCNYIATVHGAVNNYIHGIGQGTYVFLDATFAGGPNLKTVGTYLGNTPPLISDYASVWYTTSDLAMTSTRGAWDKQARTARLHGVKLWQYEFGPDAQGGAPTAAQLQKINTLHDPLFAPAYMRLLLRMEEAGYEEVGVYTGGTILYGTGSELQCWASFRSWNPIDSVRQNAAVAHMALPRTGPTRNLLTALGTTNIDGRMVLAIYDATGPYPPCGSSSTTGINWLITAPEDGNWSLALTMESTSGTREIHLFVNGVEVLPAYSVPLGVNVYPGRTIPLTRGHNVITTRPGASYVGTTVLMRNLGFTRIP